ncbi:carbohydrate ABC transporter permease [Actinoplanes derwentensis]|uniref:Carbohydrate ABC transporter membrane protein 1, CUT1 family n=1 Tax=Actinoplanes derwentensis TaxID=113562 RepID=A0A1H1SUE7_9ACTN|nr:sugar ABC transporter permease [Actinoplanes derwentensis]GID83211.1 sugar ABC transporter permease [Actinoplanes derwentensis]SDS51346.1 carbohydrate ABC transporter membrane protein 1, CUT1 family [Actinoplanes derwentensis]
MTRAHKSGRYTVAPLLLTAVAAVLFALFFVWPGALGLIYSFTDYRGIGSLDFVGFENYTELAGDADFWSSLLRTVLFVCCSVPLIYVMSLGVAVLLTNERAKGRTPAKVIFFLPWLISPIVTGVIWRWTFGESFGFVNYLLGTLGFGPVPWQSNADLSLAVVVVASAWAATAFNMLLFIAALRNVPVSYLEAGQLDGANAWQRFRHITLPAIAPTSYMVVLLSIIGQMKEFAMVQALNGGGPGTSNRLIVQYIYETGFDSAYVGYASAVSIVLMVLLLIVAYAQTRLEKRATRDI